LLISVMIETDRWWQERNSAAVPGPLQLDEILLPRARRDRRRDSRQRAHRLPLDIFSPPCAFYRMVIRVAHLVSKNRARSGAGDVCAR
jgi:hypothetical protein